MVPWTTVSARTLVSGLITAETTPTPGFRNETSAGPTVVSTNPAWRKAVRTDDLTVFADLVGEVEPDSGRQRPAPIGQRH
jgi:hypothetical protein